MEIMAGKSGSAATAAAKRTGSRKAFQGKAGERSVSSPTAMKTARKGILVVVESPAKAKTIEGYLGKAYTVLASMGHLIDLPKSRMGIDVDHGFEPEFKTVRGKAPLLQELQKAAKKSRLVLLASDNDREGEAISWHIRRSLLDKAPGTPIQRIVFDEITRDAIREAVRNPRALDEARVRAQMARRVLDRLVGYGLSPLLWKKVKSGLSAGRVQSVALRLICEREREVEAFIPVEHWSVEADFRKGRRSFSGSLVAFGPGGAPVRLGREAEAEALVAALARSSFVVGEVRESERSIQPGPPLTTSTLQQLAAKRLGFTSRKTMQIAQQLYEGIDLGRERLGLITYMRTDSTRLSPTALAELRAYLSEFYPAELPGSPKLYEPSRVAQDAHEAVRPTRVSLEPDSLGEALTKDQLRLYALIWESFVASQMTPAKVRTTEIDVQAGEGLFRIGSSMVVERGFQKVLKVSASREDREEGRVPELRVGETLGLAGLRPEQHLSRGPARFTDASMIEALEKGGIGRPSTYAPIVSVLLERYYVTQDRGQLVPTVLGRMVNDILVESFPDLIEAGFTAGMEDRLDEVESEGADWVGMIRDFYGPFKARVDEILGSLESYRGRLDEATDAVCERCGKPMVKRLGRFGFFLACTGFPGCLNTRSVPLGRCPRCGKGEIVARRKAKGRSREFFGCTRFPDCDFVTWHRPTGQACPACGQFLVEKFDKKRGAFKACINPECDWLHSQESEASHG